MMANMNFHTHTHTKKAKRVVQISMHFLLVGWTRSSGEHPQR